MQIKEIETRCELYFEFPKNGVGVEIGVCRGVNSTCLYQITKPKKLYLCDSWENVPVSKSLDSSLWSGNNQEIVARIFEDEIKNNTVELHKEYGGVFLSKLQNRSLDWIYLDANHNYEPTSIEINIALRKVKRGGIIAGHDYVTNPQVWRSGVIRAVNEKLNSGELIMEAITIEEYPSFLCRVV